MNAQRVKKENVKKYKDCVTPINFCIDLFKKKTLN